MRPLRERVWFCRPVVYWYGWATLRPFWLGNDEYHYRTLVLGWNLTGQVVIALWEFRDSADCFDGERRICPVSPWRSA